MYTHSQDGFQIYVFVWAFRSYQATFPYAASRWTKNFYSVDKCMHTSIILHDSSFLFFFYFVLFKDMKNIIQISVFQ